MNGDWRDCNLLLEKRERDWGRDASRPWDRYWGRVGELKGTLRSDNGDVHENVAEK